MGLSVGMCVVRGSSALSRLVRTWAVFTHRVSLPLFLRSAVLMSRMDVGQPKDYLLGAFVVVGMGVVGWEGGD